MTDLSSLVSEDSRAPIQRMRRYQLYRVADANDIRYPADAPATQMVQLIEGAGVDVTRGVDWVKVAQKTEQGGESMETYPAEQPSASALKGVTDATRSDEMERRAKEKEAVGLAEELQQENAALKALVEGKLAALELQQGPSELDAMLDEMSVQQLKKVLANRGVDITKFPNRRKALLEAIRVNGHPTD